MKYRRLVFVLAIIVFQAILATATTVRRLTFDDLVSKASTIVQGHVVNTNTAWTDDHKLILTTYTLAVDERIRKYRHPLPTAKKLKRHAILVLCARQHGLIVSVTRLVHFGKLPSDLRRRHDAVCAIDAAFISNTRIGTPVREIFRRGLAGSRKDGPLCIVGSKTLA